MTATTVQSPPSIMLSADELHAFGRLRGTPPPELGPDPVAGLGGEAREAAIATAFRGLLARRVLVAVDHAVPRQGVAADLAVAPGVAALLDVLWAPTLLARVVSSRADVMEHRWLVAQPGLAVQVRGFGGGLYEFTMLPVAELSGRLLEIAGPAEDERVLPEVDGFAVPQGELRAALACAEAGDPAAAVGVLVGTGVPAPAADAFTTAVGAAVASAGVVVQGAHGDELTWLDAGAAGLWLIPDAGGTARPDTAELHVRPATTAEVRSALAAFLPAVT